MKKIMLSVVVVLTLVLAAAKLPMLTALIFGDMVITMVGLGLLVGLVLTATAVEALVYFVYCVLKKN